MDPSIDQLRTAVEAQHGCPAQLVKAVMVSVLESFEGLSAWEGVVHVFDLQGHRSADRCYAWSSPVDGSSDRRYFRSVLAVPPIVSAADAVRSARGMGHKAGQRPWGLAANAN
jgi:hypothetical protein